MAARTPSKIPDPTRPRRKNTLPRAELPAGDCLCNHCSGKCCRYFSVPIETPKRWDDYDAIRWYLAHGQTLVYVEKGKWFLVVMTKCKYLDKADRCRIYHSRPKICQDYTTDECEYDEEWVFEKVFETAEQLWEYAEAVLPPRRRPKPVGPVFTIVSPPSTS